MLKHLPIAPRWFSQEALSTGEAGILVDVFSTNISAFLAAAKKARIDFFLLLATGTDLDDWGKDVGMVRNPGELDDPFRARIQAEITRPRTTVTAIEDIVNEATGLTTNVFSPWRFQDFRGNRNRTLGFGVHDPIYGRSGQTRRSSLYWMGGVIDVKTYGFSPITRSIAQDSAAAGVKVYFTTINQDEVLSPDLSVTPVHVDREIWYDFKFPAITEDYIRSGNKGRRSGYIRTREDIIITKEYNSSYMTILWDEPLFFGPWSVYDNVYTWENLGNYTWDQAIVDGHSANPPAYYASLNAYYDEPQTIAALHLFDEPTWTGPYSVYDNALNWAVVGSYTWDSATTFHTSQGNADYEAAA